MRSSTIVAMGLIAVVLGGLAACHAEEKSSGTSIGAKVMEVEGTVESTMSGGAAKVLKPGDLIGIGEKINVQRGSILVLAMSDNAVRKFTGPTTIEIKQEAGDQGGSVLANLSSGVIDLLFGAEEGQTEAVMATRVATARDEIKTTLPVLIDPAPYSGLLEIPKEFKWRKVEGVRLYRVSVYDSEQLLWQGTTSDSDIRCPGEYCDFEPGGVYYWMVEALVGNSSLRSRAAEFRILDRASQSGFLDAVRQTDSAVSDPALATSIKVRICLGSRLYSQALDLIKSRYAGQEPDRQGYNLRAQVYEAMGLAEDAFRDYRNALTVPGPE
ncbi:MAG: hypothetical protein ABIJ00_14940 [Candidatus Eisenbacteria bacterium]